MEKGLGVMHERGFHATSVRDIVQAAGVPQGSFSNNFESKEAFGLAALERHIEQTNAEAVSLRQPSPPPLNRLRAWIDEQIRYAARGIDIPNGCFIGKLGAEANDEIPAIRLRVRDVFDEQRKAVAYCLAEAVKAGDLPKKMNVDETAHFVVSSLQGAILLWKSTGMQTSITAFKRVLFSTILSSA